MSNGEHAVATQPAPAKMADRVGWGWWLLPLALVGYLYYGIVGALVLNWWANPNFSHGFFVPLFSAFLLWQERERLASIKPQPSWFGLIVIACALAGLLVGVFGAELFLQRSSLVLLAAGLVIQFLGWRFFRAVLFPWAFLLLMIPIPAIVFNEITFPLQLLASRLASVVLPVIGVPVLREGNVIVLPAMPLEVAEACSGIRSLMSLGTLAIIYGYFMDRRIWVRIVLALASVPIAVAANALRVVGTGVAVQHWDPQRALGFFHEFSGWAIFVASLLLLFAVHGALMLVAPDRSTTATTGKTR
jgi:exosortase